MRLDDSIQQRDEARFRRHAEVGLLFLTNDTWTILRNAEDAVSRRTNLRGKQNNGLWETSRGGLWTRA